jgi:DeoR/GlpR family transcriptional regulator of sugar metabolism
VVEGDTILLDSGTTIAQFARLLPDMPMTVLTNSYHVVMELAPKKNINVVAIGGTLDRTTMSYLGPSAEQSLGNYFVDKSFFSCRGIDIHRGVTDGNEHLSAFKRKMMEHSRLHYLLADHSKFNTKALAVYAKVQDFDEIITDPGVDRKVVTTFENLGCPLQFNAARNGTG